MSKVKGNVKKQLEAVLKRRSAKKYVLHLYVAGLSPRSQKSIENIKGLCDKYLKNRCELKIRDIYQNPIFAKEGQIVAAPTLIKKMPLPIRKFVGDLSDAQRLLVALDLRSK